MFYLLDIKRRNIHLIPKKASRETCFENILQNSNKLYLQLLASNSSHFHVSVCRIIAVDAG